MAEEPLRISLEDLTLSAPPQEEPGHERLQFDLGNLCVVDPRTLPAEEFDAKDKTVVAKWAADATQALLSKLSQLPRPRGDGVIALPPPTTPLPRAKPFPTAKPLTRWQTFAKSKGIKKKKKERKVWDEGRGEWRRRYGYQRANDPKDVIILDAKSSDKPGESPFERLENDKKERVAKQSKRELRNAQRSAKQGASLPSSVQLVADLPRKGKGHPTQRKHLKDGIERASKLAGMSTASLGKFDKRLEGEAANERVSQRKSRTLVNADPFGEKHFVQKMSEKLVKEHSDAALDVTKAMGRLEADKRRQRHEEKISEQLSGKKRPRSQKKKSKRDAMALPKMKVTSRAKKLKRRTKK